MLNFYARYSDFNDRVELCVQEVKVILVEIS